MTCSTAYCSHDYRIKETDEWCTVIGDNVLGNAKLANEVISNKAGHSSSTCLLKSYSLDLVGITLCSSDDLI